MSAAAEVCQSRPRQLYSNFSAMRWVATRYLEAQERVRQSRSPTGSQLDRLRAGYIGEADEWGRHARAESEHGALALLTRLMQLLTDSETAVAMAICTSIDMEEYHDIVWASDLSREAMHGQLDHFRTCDGQDSEPLWDKVVVVGVVTRPSGKTMQEARVTSRAAILSGHDVLHEGEWIDEDRIVVLRRRPQFPSNAQAAERLGITLSQLKDAIKHGGARILDSVLFWEYVRSEP